jgi:tetratricopeptide (TPR) repeat protein
MSKKILGSVLFFIGTIIIFMGANFIFSENIAAQDNSACFMIQPSGQVVDLAEICEKRQDLKAAVEIQRLSAEILDQMQTGQFQHALNNLTQVININPNMPDVYYERATMHIATKKPGAAIADFQKALDLFRTMGDSESADSMQNLIKETQQNFLLVSS